MRGRVFGAMTAAARAAMPPGVLFTEPLLVRLGLRGMLLAVGGCYLIATLSMHRTAVRRGRDAKVAALPA